MIATDKNTNKMTNLAVEPKSKKSNNDVIK